MFTVVFEVHPAPGKKDEYLAHAKELKPILESIDGFIDNERFGSQTRDGWVLSLSTWRDEKAVVRWRTVGKHHLIQQKGRDGIFSDYHLRVCEVTGDDQPPAGHTVVEQRFDVTATGRAQALAITEVWPVDGAPATPSAATLAAHLGLDTQDEALVDFDVFESITHAGKRLLLTAWTTADAANAWTPTSFAGAANLRHRRVRTIRDYGMFDRREAAQYHPDARRTSDGPSNAHDLTAAG